MRVVLVFGLILSGLALSGCGTARGVFEGAGNVLEGVATDIKSVGNSF
jgi:predicted small secreted protein